MRDLLLSHVVLQLGLVNARQEETVTPVTPTPPQGPIAQRSPLCPSRGGERSTDGNCG